MQRSCRSHATQAWLNAAGDRRRPSTERGLRTGAGDAFEPVSVQWVRFSHKLKNLKERLLAAGWLTSRQIEAKLGVGRTTLGRWRAEGRIGPASERVIQDPHEKQSRPSWPWR